MGPLLPSPLVGEGGALAPDEGFYKKFNAGEVNRTPDLLITNQLLYQLSYPGIERAESINKNNKLR
jgi:hypothetical protein